MTKSDVRLAALHVIDFVSLSRDRSPRVIDPDAGIDQNQRSLRMAFKSPRQSSLPRSRRISPCLFSRSKVRELLQTGRAQSIPHELIVNINIRSHRCLSR